MDASKSHCVVHHAVFIFNLTVKFDEAEQGVPRHPEVDARVRWIRPICGANNVTCSACIVRPHAGLVVSGIGVSASCSLDRRSMR